MSAAPQVKSFFHPPTSTFSYVVWDAATRRAAVIDSVMHFEPASGRTSTRYADEILDFVRAQELETQWVLETHAHADHLAAGAYVQQALGGTSGIGNGIAAVQRHFCAVFDFEPEFAADGSQFDHLFADGERFRLGEIEARVLATPGHTPDHLTYVIGDAAFVGDTLFMPDGGTARCDFPGGDARTLYRSIQRILALPEATRIFVLHDYRPNGREYRNETSVAEQRRANIHVGAGRSEDDFAKMRNARDATLDLPTLIIPSVQVNVRGGRWPPAAGNGVRYLKTPLDRAQDFSTAAARVPE